MNRPGVDRPPVLTGDGETAACLRYDCLGIPCRARDARAGQYRYGAQVQVGGDEICHGGDGGGGGGAVFDGGDQAEMP